MAGLISLRNVMRTPLQEKACVTAGKLLNKVISCSFKRRKNLSWVYTHNPPFPPRPLLSDCTHLGLSYNALTPSPPSPASFSLQPPPNATWPSLCRPSSQNHLLVTPDFKQLLVVGFRSKLSKYLLKASRKRHEHSTIPLYHSFPLPTPSERCRTSVQSSDGGIGLEVMRRMFHKRSRESVP